MRILVSGSTKTVRSIARQWPDHLGLLMTPNNGNTVGSILDTGLMWAADNGAYSGFDPAKFRRFLRKVAWQPRCLFAAVPDVVADARATLARFAEWRGEMEGCRLAFVGQDGAEDLDLPWDEFHAYFVGGSTRWKLSRASYGLVAEAVRRGKYVHMGRVNSMRRLAVAHEWGCDSIDGSSYSRFCHRTLTHRPDMSLERHLRFLRGLELAVCPGLFDAVPPPG